MIEELEMLWQTHDFSLEKIAVLEDEFNFLLNQLNTLLESHASEAFQNLNLDAEDVSYIMNLPNSEDNINKDVLLAKFKEATHQLNLFYNKQITTINELSSFYETHKYEIPEEREVAVGSFKELKSVTIHLRDVLNASHKDVTNMLDEI